MPHHGGIVWWFLAQIESNCFICLQRFVQAKFAKSFFEYVVWYVQGSSKQRILHHFCRGENGHTASCRSVRLRPGNMPWVWSLRVQTQPMGLIDRLTDIHGVVSIIMYHEDPNNSIYNVRGTSMYNITHWLSTYLKVLYFKKQFNTLNTMLKPYKVPLNN